MTDICRYSLRRVLGSTSPLLPRTPLLGSWVNRGNPAPWVQATLPCTKNVRFRDTRQSPVFSANLSVLSCTKTRTIIYVPKLDIFNEFWYN